VERVWQDFKNTGRFQVLDVDVWNGSIVQVQGYITVTGATFPVLRDAGYLTGAAYYGMNRDNYLVIDPEGIVRYASTTVQGGIGGWQDAAVRAAIVSALTVGVEPTTWSGVKGLYR
jgi:hypothetical protein